MARILEPCFATGGALPSQIVGKSWLPPRGGTTLVSGDDRDVLPPTDRKQNPFDGVEILEHDPVLNHHVRFTHLVEVAPGLQVHGPGVNARVSLEERHSDALEIAIDERPETTVGVAIFGAD